MNDSISVLNELLVELFNDILQIELKAFSRGEFKDLSLTEIHTIEAIGINASGKSMTEIANILKITTGTLTKAIDKLIKKEYVERERMEKDRRIVLIKPTSKGKLVYKVHEMFHKKMVKETIDGLTEEEEKVLIKALTKLNVFFKSKIS